MLDTVSITLLVNVHVRLLQSLVVLIVELSVLRSLKISSNTSSATLPIYGGLKLIAIEQVIGGLADTGRVICVLAIVIGECSPLRFHRDDTVSQDYTAGTTDGRTVLFDEIRRLFLAVGTLEAHAQVFLPFGTLAVARHGARRF